MKTYRLTRCIWYKNPNTRAFHDLSARQGYYIRAENEDEALRKWPKIFQKNLYLLAMNGRANLFR